jgi:hypothetical protein
LVVVAWHMHQACPPLIVPFAGGLLLLPSCRKEEGAQHEGQAHHGQQGEAAVACPHGCAVDGRASVLVWLPPVWIVQCGACGSGAVIVDE